MPMPLIPDIAVFQRKLATLPVVTYQAGETVLSTASTTGRLLILKEGEVAVVKEGLEIARVTEPGAVFGELSVLLDQPHTADVRALENSQFHVADAATILRVDPMALLKGDQQAPRINGGGWHWLHGARGHYMQPTNLNLKAIARDAEATKDRQHQAAVGRGRVCPSIPE